MSPGLTKEEKIHNGDTMKKFSLKLSTIIHFLIGLLLLWPSSKGIPCTLLGAIENSVEGGGVLIGKTRDRPKTLEQIFIEVTPK